MRTAVLYGKEDIRIEDRPVPEPGPGQMLVKIDYVGICGTDIEFYKLGQTPTPLPKILGHENSGTIVKLGEGVTDFQVGQRVLCGPPAHCKENCSPCKEGKTNPLYICRKKSKCICRCWLPEKSLSLAW